MASILEKAALALNEVVRIKLLKDDLHYGFFSVENDVLVFKTAPQSDWDNGLPTGEVYFTPDSLRNGIISGFASKLGMVGLSEPASATAGTVPSGFSVGHVITVTFPANLDAQAVLDKCVPIISDATEASLFLSATSHLEYATRTLPPEVIGKLAAGFVHHLKDQYTAEEQQTFLASVREELMAASGVWVARRDHPLQQGTRQ